MKLVIKISEDVYTRLFDNGIQDNEISVDDVCEMARAIRLGMPLPKGHGRLIDGDYLYKKFVVNKCLDSLVLQFIKDEPSIIEADKAEIEDAERRLQMNNLQEIKIDVRQGWECPKCGKVYAPWVSECSLCGRNEGHTTWTSSDASTKWEVYNKVMCKNCSSKTDTCQDGLHCPMG